MVESDCANPVSIKKKVEISSKNFKINLDENELSLNMEDTSKKKKTQNPFEKLGLSSFVTRAVYKLGFNLPTPIQRKVVPVVLAGRDVVAMARTGSGKTAAFLLPIIEKLFEHKTIVGIRSVILEPTRELAFQVEKVACQLSRFTNLRITSIVGGSSMENQFSSLSRNPDIVVACPGRLMHQVIETDIPLTTVQFLVIDEADQMFDLGLGDQVLLLLKRMNSNKQCILTSATLPSQLVEFAAVGLRSPFFIRLDCDATISPTLDMWFLYIRKEEKLAGLLFLLRHILLSVDRCVMNSLYSTGALLPQGVLIFTASRHHVDFLGAFLTKFGINAQVAYGSMDLQARVESVSRFRKGLSKVLIVTDVAARGLDLPVVGCVLNFDFPISPKHFVHCVGRTARANRPGLAVSFVTREELAYAEEVLLFSGVPGFEKAAKITSSGFDENISTTKNFKSIISGFPDLSFEMELVRDAFQNDIEMQNLARTMANASIQHMKTRRPASHQSIKKAKRLIDGDSIELSSSIHPVFFKCLPRLKTLKCKEESTRDEFIKTLHSIKPKTTSKVKKGGRHGGVLNPSVVDGLEKLQFTTKLKNFSINFTKNECRNMAECDIDFPYTHSKNVVEDVDVAMTNASSTNGLSCERMNGSLTVRRPRMSVAERRRLKKERGNVCDTATKTIGTVKCDAKLMSIEKPASITFDVFDWKTKAVNSGKPFFFLDNEKPTDDETKTLREAHFQLNPRKTDITYNAISQMNAAALDLVPEDHTQRRHKTKLARRWNAQRKKYVMASVDCESGDVLRTKKIKQRNEAGVICRGEIQKKGIYKKWVQSTHCVIQKAGELEKDQSFIRRNRYSHINNHGEQPEETT
ncbi:ATP-dependent RNA helicase ddx54-like isoform X2 [Hylaeus volcanicus]|uniref:ATP-dependent RNA helicase ddx54-like isoform X2 n=1 Tax=Hylaeus volcanicus TaxID=313075 RepID=UPI0023B79752|nr:ATP-dependent RNA helicase ddx54-like isoform X2 [Hylaeus volcanicus]